MYVYTYVCMYSYLSIYIYIYIYQTCSMNHFIIQGPCTLTSHAVMYPSSNQDKNSTKQLFTYITLLFFNLLVSTPEHPLVHGSLTFILISVFCLQSEELLVNNLENDSHITWGLTTQTKGRYLCIVTTQIIQKAYLVRHNGYCSM